jgi:formylglycine-generating enzyme required for sulfatase activity
MSLEIPPELIEQALSGNVVLFLGAGISIPNGDVLRPPTGRELAEQLAKQVGYIEEDISLPKIAQFYELERGRNSLIQYLIKRIGDARLQPLQTHKIIARLPIKILITTNYDRLLEQELDYLRRPYIKVVGNSEIAFLDESKLLLVKWHGSIEQPESIIITEDDYLNFFRGLPSVSIVLKSYFATKTLLFIGYSLTDQNFRRAFTEITSDIARYRRMAYAVQRKPSNYDQVWWHSKGVQIMDTDAVEFLEALQLHITKKRRAEVEFLSTNIDFPEYPYKFLDYFETNDRTIFFGRDYESAALLNHLLAHRLTVVYGYSGTGKTSLIKAGVMPKLREMDYKIIDVRALRDPALAIKEAVVQLVRGNNKTSLSPKAKGQDLSAFLKSTLPTGSRFTIFIDQFEEFFIRQGDAARQAFVGEMAKCLEMEDMDIHIVISLRSDYFVRLDELEEQIPTIYDNKFRIDKLDVERAREAIVEPAAQFGLSYEPVLLDEMLKDLEESGIEPPHLQIVCYLLYKHLKSDETVFKLSDYLTLGRTQGILASYIDAVLASFESQDEREAARGVLKCMVTAEETKEALSSHEIARDAIVRQLGLNEAQIEIILRQLQNHRVIRKLSNSDLYELSHEVLARKVWEWISDEDIIFKYIRSMIRQALTDWQQIGTLMESGKRILVNEHRDLLVLSAEETELIFRSALVSGDEVAYWLSKGVEFGAPIWKISEEVLMKGDAFQQAMLLEALGSIQDHESLRLLSIALESLFPAQQRQALRSLERLPMEEAKDILIQRNTLNELILIPSGECIIGSDNAQETWEHPAHDVFVDDFFIARFPVTNIEYKQFIDETGHKVPENWQNGIYPLGKADHPVTYVDWFDSIEYCKWLEQKTGRAFRLPTEVEWEKAASWNPQAGKKCVYPWGDEFDKEKCNTSESGIGDTTQIGLYVPKGGDSFYGVSDMAGNTWDWCSTRLTNKAGQVYQYPYDAFDGREDVESEGTHVIRGGSWRYDKYFASTTYRFHRNPTFRTFNIGFRIVVSDKSDKST